MAVWYPGRVKPTLHRSWSADLDTRTLYALLRLRVQVFVVEQACAYEELDGRDLHEDTRHLWLADGDTIVATLRLMESHGADPHFRIGRLCTVADRRGQGHTKRLLEAALAEVGTADCRIDAQSYLLDMYAAHGFATDGEEYLEDGIAHIPMLRRGR